MVWYNLTIGKYHIRYTPLKVETKDYPLCDSEGNLLKKEFEGEGKTSYFIDDKGIKHSQAFRLINDKPTAKLDKTKEVSNFKEVDSNEVNDLIAEKEYVIECDFLLSELQNTNKALKFAFTNGNGFKVFLAYVYVDKLYNQLFMRLGQITKSQALKTIDMNSQKTKKEIELTISGVDKAKVEDLIAI